MNTLVNIVCLRTEIRNWSFPHTVLEHSPVDVTSDRRGDILYNYSLIIQVLFVVAMCRLAIFPRRFEGTNIFVFQGLGAPLNVEALRTFQAQENTNPATKCHIPQQLNFQQNRYRHLKP
jgi:hypothetical protein